MKLTFMPLFLLLSVSVFPAQAKMYKWVDENGQTHFGDKIPAKYLVKKHEELNQQGDVIKHYKAAETEEQKAARRKLEREKKQQELVDRKKRQRDRVLLDTYTTERDLVLARDSRLDAVDSQIRLAESIIEDSNKKIVALNKQIDAIKASGREVPADMYARVEREQKQVDIHTQVSAKHSKRRKEIATQFNGYIERFRVLKTEQKARREKAAKNQ